MTEPNELSEKRERGKRRRGTQKREKKRRRGTTKREEGELRMEDITAI